MTLYVLTNGEWDDYHIVCHMEGENVENFRTLFYSQDNYIEFLEQNEIDYRFNNSNHKLEYKIFYEYEGKVGEHWLEFYDPEYLSSVPSYLKWFLNKYKFTAVHVEEIHL